MAMLYEVQMLGEGPNGERAEVVRQECAHNVFDAAMQASLNASAWGTPYVGWLFRLIHIGPTSETVFAANIQLAQAIEKLTERGK
jgi:hypothetical protein